MASDRLDRVLADDYVAGLEGLPLDDVRSRRTECQEIEVGLSYARRIVQGRLDIIHAELERRATGGGPSAVADLVHRLQEGEMLGDQPRPGGVGRLPTLMAPGADNDEFIAEVEQVARHETLANLPELSDDDVRALAEELEHIERSLSDRRRHCLDRIDVLQAEIVRRYKTGAASADSLLTS